MKLPCLRCKKFPPECTCPPLVVEPEPPVVDEPPSRPRVVTPRPEIVKLRREKRNGREVIVMEGFPGTIDLESLARELKRRCATGGTVKGRTIEIQGDARDEIAAILLEHGFRSKRAGG
ncbi:MAG: translation initiation factor [Planctomycetes bacterium]|nr:translation initiation factor [Planctomycetota bacterium]MBI3847610.1 translation initiation factor [Planctomycetota bacterium]